MHRLSNWTKYQRTIMYLLNILQVKCRTMNSLSNLFTFWYLNLGWLYSLPHIMKRKYTEWWSTNSTNITKTNNHLSSQLIEHIKKTPHMMLEIELLASDKHKNVAVLNYSHSVNANVSGNQMVLYNKRIIRLLPVN